MEFDLELGTWRACQPPPLDTFEHKIMKNNSKLSKVGLMQGETSKKDLRVGESNPGLQRDRRGY